MACTHLQELYRLCHQHDVRFQLSSSDLIRIVCRECGAQDVCPSILTDEYDSREEGVRAEGDGGVNDNA